MTRILGGPALTLAGILAACTACAQDTPASSAARDQDAVIERLSNEVSYAADGTGWREQFARIRVQSDAAVKDLGVLSFSYRNDVERVDRIEIQVHKANGTSVATPASNIQDLPAEVTRSAPTYSDLREKQVPVKSLSVGDVLEFRCHITRTKADVPGEFWFDYTFVKEQIVLDETLPAGRARSKRTRTF